MEKSLAAAKNLISNWDALMKARPIEADFTPYGFPELAYRSFSALFSDWVAAFEQLESKTKWQETTDVQVADIIIARWINEVVSYVAQAQGNAVPWLLQTAFLERVSNIGNLLATTVDRRVNVAKAIAKDFEKAGSAELAAILESAPIARELIQKKNELDKAADRISKAVEDSESSYQDLTSTSSKLQSLYSDIDSAHKSVLEKNAEVQNLHTDVVAFRNQAEVKAGELERKIEVLSKAVEDADKAAVNATNDLSKVLIDARKQGLAGAFDARGKKVLAERWAWGVAFVVTVIGLAILSAFFASSIKNFTYEELVVALLRRVALAAPLVWVGWYAAKQLGRLGRIQEDYEYKAATALAFQSYKSEVEAVGDDELTAELLARAIHAFGENPVRLYDHALQDPATPMEDLLKGINSDKSRTLFGRIVEALKSPT